MMVVGRERLWTAMRGNRNLGLCRVNNRNNKLSKDNNNNKQ